MQTREQTMIRRYIATQFHLDSVRIYNESPNIVTVCDTIGEQIRFSTNRNCDIIDADTGQVYAYSWNNRVATSQ